MIHTHTKKIAFIEVFSIRRGGLLVIYRRKEHRNKRGKEMGHEIKYLVVIPTKCQLATTGNVSLKLNECHSRLK